VRTLSRAVSPAFVTRRRETNWDWYFQKQMGDPEMKALLEEELKALRVGVQRATVRQQKGLSQTQLAAKVGMSAPNISRIEASPGRNLTLQTYGEALQRAGLRGVLHVSASPPCRQEPPGTALADASLKPGPAGPRRWRAGAPLGRRPPVHEAPARNTDPSAPRAEGQGVVPVLSAPGGEGQAEHARE